MTKNFNLCATAIGEFHCFFKFVKFGGDTQGRGLQHDTGNSLQVRSKKVDDGILFAYTSFVLLFRAVLVPLFRWHNVNYLNLGEKEWQ
ncbi:MAG TPA: hypothetical protein DEB50_04145 [Desulfobacter sp.]|jgi:hypothetical protein|nr:hypothetical protein [Desulfobacter sp.]